jgi:hypothetical protein
MRINLILILSLFAFGCFGQKFKLKKAEFVNISGGKNTQGVAAADYDLDGDMDFYIVAQIPYDANTPSTWSKLYTNNGDGTFTDITTDAGLLDTHLVTKSDQTVGARSGASWGDYNNDGYPDLFLANDGLDRLYKNNGNGTFTDVTNVAGISGCETCYSGTGLWWDFDLDGDLDLYVSDWGSENRMYINNGNDSFTESAQQLGINSGLHSWMALPIDIDEDGDLDLYVSNDPEPNIMYINNAGVFTDEAPALALDHAGNGMGIAVSDFNNDGIFDIYVTNIFTNLPNPFFVRQNIDEPFTNIASEAKVNNTAWGWDIAFFDADHDLDEDLAVSTYGRNDRSFYFRNITETGSHIFLDKSTITGLNHVGGSFGLESFDYDNDGDIDLLYSNSNNAPYLSDNNINENVSNNNWIQFELVGTRSNRDGFGSKIKITVDGKSYIRLHHGAGVGRQSKKSIHFGLANYEMIDEVMVTWPNGTIERFTDVPSNQLVVITEEQGMTSRALKTIVKREEFYDFDLSKSIARVWNEELLEAIRNDLARPTVHARNLFHISAAMYDVFSAFDPTLQSYLFNKTVDDFSCDYNQEFSLTNSEENINEAISYAAFSLLVHRFQNSPNAVITDSRIIALMTALGFDPSNPSGSGRPAAEFGNFIAQCYIDYGLQDGSNEVNAYANTYYSPVNDPLDMSKNGNPTMADPNRWQPLTLETFIDQSGNILSNNTPDFLSPEWGDVLPFSLTEEDMDVYERDGDTYKVYVDPGPPPYLSNSSSGQESSDFYKWGFSLVAAWSSHLSPSDGVDLDISPRNIGNITHYPENLSEYQDFYDFENGGDNGEGRSINPFTGAAYEPNIVPRGDYARVLAEFWADGPHSETPPGHWFTLLNHVSDDENIIKRLEGAGKPLSDLEWDLFSYFVLGGAMHDVAISSWSIKGYYDYIRPVSAIRYMADKGQSSDVDLPSYHIEGIHLIEGFIELVDSNDPLAVSDVNNIGKIKLKAWRGPAYVNDEQTDDADVDWILAGDWWPYQRPSFVTPPFAGFVSGHSTYSRAAAEVMTRLTGSEYFPGGMGEFVAEKNEFLVFEEGPSVDVVLQWATYRDASDQCSLSRIWGGIHPPADDIPGRKIGEYIGNKAYDFAKSYFNDFITSSAEDVDMAIEPIIVYPIPSDLGFIDVSSNGSLIEEINLIDLSAKKQSIQVEKIDGNSKIRVSFNLAGGIYLLNIKTATGTVVKKIVIK